MKVKITKLITLTCLLIVSNAMIAHGQFIEDFGDAGTFRTIKGQVRDSLDAPIPRATLLISNKTGESYEIKTDDRGNFAKSGMPSGNYEVEVRAAGFNIGRYSLRVSRHNLFALWKTTVIQLSPGCATGISGVSAKRRIK